ncbi:MAG: NAD(P)H-dependent glycerol-3-phosphate dehydrogenase [Paracoccus sp. (in: a-proteobacteria)]|uniref:NAD(P)H-dependent glycerol-3-phosphate dehydrogenase n=1 Tax=Paracoccus sp. TaxID=267 RepID=UPI0026E032D1|nr:NAD(P)H-dependent glycerol-3-phosphate dehydrogenase [Paracoccus sp. (in: a-proteobacteria)]MDO5621209.1 NAD(P)H-dependent glycerol-3-phosphate dehydrogenase [Paracoccus sp. (in: a-proteobacteria)]
MIAVLGAGAFGTALAVTLAAKGPVTLWGRRTDWARENPRLPGVRLPDTIRVTDDLDCVTAPLVILALPAQTLRGFLADQASRLDGRALVSAAKGIDLHDLTGPSALIAAACPQATVAVLTGPSFAADIARGLPTALTLACADADRGRDLQHKLSTPTLRLYRTTDVTGAELGGALKNVIAIAAGAAIGAGLGDSARAAIVTRGFAEMTRLAGALGARPETLTGLSGLGDLMLTCTSAQSRNFRFGAALGAGQPFDPATTVEGAATARAAARLADARGLDLPVTAMVARLAAGDLAVQDAMKALLNRPLKEE